MINFFVVKPEDQAEAHVLFDDLGIAVEPGQWLLGSFITMKVHRSL